MYKDMLGHCSRDRYMDHVDISRYIEGYLTKYCVGLRTSGGGSNEALGASGMYGGRTETKGVHLQTACSPLPPRLMPPSTQNSKPTIPNIV